MPIYEYCCEKCEREIEVEQRITDEPLRVCPHCRSRKLRRLISMTSFVLKGSGWYSDLYASSSKSKSEGAAPPTEAGSEAKEGRSEAPAASADKGADPGGKGKKGKKADAKAAA